MDHIRLIRKAGTDQLTNSVRTIIQLGNSPRIRSSRLADSRITTRDDHPTSTKTRRQYTVMRMLKAPLNLNTGKTIINNLDGTIINQEMLSSITSDRATILKASRVLTIIEDKTSKTIISKRENSVPRKVCRNSSFGTSVTKTWWESMHLLPSMVNMQPEEIFHALYPI